MYQIKSIEKNERAILMFIWQVINWNFQRG